MPNFNFKNIDIPKISVENYTSYMTKAQEIMDSVNEVVPSPKSLIAKAKSKLDSEISKVPNIDEYKQKGKDMLESAISKVPGVNELRAEVDAKMQRVPSEEDIMSILVETPNMEWEDIQSKVVGFMKSMANKGENEQ